jgi:hypothetical protein
VSKADVVHPGLQDRAAVGRFLSPERLSRGQLDKRHIECCLVGSHTERGALRPQLLQRRLQLRFEDSIHLPLFGFILENEPLADALQFLQDLGLTRREFPQLARCVSIEMLGLICC